MKRAIIYITNPGKLNTTRCIDKHKWSKDNDSKMFQTKDQKKNVFLVSDQKKESSLKAILSEIFDDIDKYSYVYHSDDNMTVPKKELINCFPVKPKQLEGILGMHDFDENDQRGVKTKIYNKYLFDILESVNKSNQISDESFESLWKLFEKKSELELALEYLHSKWVSINFKDELSEQEIDDLVTNRNSQLNALIK